MATRRCALLAMRIRCLSSLVLNDISTQQAVQSVCSLTGQELLRHTEESIRNGCLEEALKSAELLQQQGIPISRDLAHGLFRECSKGKTLDNVRRLQALIVNSGLDSVAIFNDHLIRLFTAHRSLGEAYQAFCNVAKPSKYTWNSIIGAHAKLGEGEKALQLYERMLFSGVESDKYTFTAVLQACGATSNLDQGRHFHDQVVERGFLSDVILGSALVDMYCKCGKLSEARKLFDELPNRNMVTWGAMIAGYAQQGEGVLALECFKTMQLKGIKPNNVIYFSILKACGSIGDIEQGRITHKQIVEAGLHLDIFVGNNLVDMYIKCGSLKEAQQVFDSLPSKDVVSWGTLIGGYAKSGNIEEAYKLLKKAPKRDVVSWGAVISGYAQCGKGHLALQYFYEMQQDNIKPDKVIFLSVLQACGNIKAIDQGRQIHDQVIENGDHSDVFIQNTLVDMYAKCGDLGKARDLFDQLPTRDVVSWGAIISGYAQHGEGLLALRCFENMQHDGVKPNSVVFSSILKACGSIGAIEHGRLIEEQISKSGMLDDVFVGSSLVDMYAKSGSLDEARKVFDKLPNRNVVSWGAMIAGYAQHAEGVLALECYDNMQQEGIKPNNIIFLSVLKACGSIGAIDQGRQIHKNISEGDLEWDVLVWNTLVDMYAKCGSLVEARRVFDKLPNRTVVSWNAMITGYASVGNARVAMQCFEEMEYSGVDPNDVTFIGILSACGREGMVREGREYFKSMKVYGVEPDKFHYNCMVHLLGHAGFFDEAEEILKGIQVPNITGWKALLNACLIRGEVELGKRCFHEVMHLDPSCASGYVLMSNIYANGSKILVKDDGHLVQDYCVCGKQ